MATFDVLLPVKNGKLYLREALDSILLQTFGDWRLLILDHGSTDGSLELGHEYAERDKRVVVCPFPDAKGLSGLLNCGLDRCDSRYVLRQDADDISLPERMAILAGVFEADTDLVLLGSLGEIIDQGGRRIGRLDMPTGPYGVSSGALFRIPVAHPAAAMRLDGLRRLGARYGQDFLGAVPVGRRLHVPGLAEDYFMFGQLALAAKCMNVDRELIQYRWHGANVGALNYLDQMQVALNISRYLAESLSIMHGSPAFDPAPFCNHGDRLFDIDKLDFSPEYHVMRTALVKALPVSYELSRELSFRKVISNRNRGLMALRFCRHASRFGARHAELRTTRSWMIRGLRNQAILKLTSAGLRREDFSYFL